MVNEMIRYQNDEYSETKYSLNYCSVKKETNERMSKPNGK